MTATPTCCGPLRATIASVGSAVRDVQRPLPQAVRSLVSQGREHVAVQRLQAADSDAREQASRRLLGRGSTARKPTRDWPWLRLVRRRRPCGRKEASPGGEARPGTWMRPARGWRGWRSPVSLVKEKLKGRRARRVARR